MEQSPLKFSLVLATVGRTDEPVRFLASLDAQPYRNVELIVVDQNEDDRLASILAPYQGKFPLIHLHSVRGLSRARNVGLKYVTGDLITFPDDDCWYPAELLLQVATLCEEHPIVSGFTGRSTDGAGGTEGRWLDKCTPVSKYNVWRTGISFGIFLRRHVVTAVGEFDETLGVGARTPWGSGEETDYLLRAIAAGFQLLYCPQLVLYHPIKVPMFNDEAIQRAREYSPGHGRVLRKNGFPWVYFIFVVSKSLIGALLAMVQGNLGKMRFFFALAAGRCQGWRS